MRRVPLAPIAAVFAASLVGKLFAAAQVPPGAATAWLWLCADDAFVAALIGLGSLAAPRAVVAALAVVVAGYAAVNTVFVQALGTPLVASLLVGADAAMSDSIARYLDLAIWLPAFAVAVAAGAGAWLARARSADARLVAAVAAAALGLALLGPPPRHPAHRNACAAFVRSLLPRALPAAPALGEPGSLRAAATDGDAASLATAPLAAFAGAGHGRSVVFVVLESAATRFVWPEHGASAMPFLEQLAASGLHCPQAMAVHPDSIEGQVALFCALPPMPDARPEDYAPHGAAALPQRLRPHGYATALFHAGRFRFLGMEHVLAPMGFDVLADAAAIGGDAESSFGIDEESTVDALLHWVDGLPAGQRFLACYLPIAGHHPYASPAGGPFPTGDELGCYRNALHYADRALHRLWLGLTARRAADELLLCVAGDHGQAFGEHPGNHGHCFELYDENLRVPFVFVLPGTALRGTTNAVCSHLAIAPTLLDLLGLAAEPASLLRRPLRGGRAFAFADRGELLVAVRDGDWKLIHAVQTGTDRLFDLARDPGERRDLAAEWPALVQRLRRDALAFLGAARLGPAAPPHERWRFAAKVGGWTTGRVEHRIRGVVALDPDDPDDGPEKEKSRDLLSRKRKQEGLRVFRPQWRDHRPKRWRGPLLQRPVVPDSASRGPEPTE